ncbi:hypothetical protein CYMTET_52607, partial [Cymbomonas tetramitiformis]
MGSAHDSFKVHSNSEAAVGSRFCGKLLAARERPAWALAARCRVDRTSMSEIVGIVGMRHYMDVTTGWWEAVGSMGTKRFGMGAKRMQCAAVMHGQHIYAIGGLNGFAELETVERMDVTTGQWE